MTTAPKGDAVSATRCWQITAGGVTWPLYFNEAEARAALADLQTRSSEFVMVEMAILPAAELARVLGLERPE